MRERIAILVCLVAIAVALALSAFFALQHNQSSTPQPASPASSHAAQAPPAVHPGKVVFDQQRCASCHSLHGAGNPRHPLDGLAARLSPVQLRDGITGQGLSARGLSRAVADRKSRYLNLPDADMQSLIAYLSSQSPPR